MAKALLLPCLLFLASTLRGQLPGPHGFQPEQNNSFTVTVDGAGRNVPDNILITAQVPALEAAVTFSRSLDVRPGIAIFFVRCNISGCMTMTRMRRSVMSSTASPATPAAISCTA
jgi:hypothetical protein